MFVLRVFQKKAKSGITYRRQDIELVKERLNTAEQFVKELARRANAKCAV